METAAIKPKSPVMPTRHPIKPTYPFRLLLGQQHLRFDVLQVLAEGRYSPVTVHGHSNSGSLQLSEGGEVARVSVRGGEGAGGGMARSLVNLIQPLTQSDHRRGSQVAHQFIIL